MRITGTDLVGRSEPVSRGTPIATPVEGVSFVDTLSKALASVEQKNQDANDAIAGMLNGSVDVHDTMIAMHEAEEALQLTIAVRNKMVQAYQDIMRMAL